MLLYDRGERVKKLLTDIAVDEHGEALAFYKGVPRLAQKDMAIGGCGHPMQMGQVID